MSIRLRPLFQAGGRFVHGREVVKEGLSPSSASLDVRQVDMSSLLIVERVGPLFPLG